MLFVAIASWPLRPRVSVMTDDKKSFMVVTVALWLWYTVQSCLLWQLIGIYVQSSPAQKVPTVEDPFVFMSRPNRSKSKLTCRVPHNPTDTNTTTMKFIKLTFSLLFAASAAVAAVEESEQFDEVAAAFRLSSDLVHESYLRGVATTDADDEYLAVDGNTRVAPRNNNRNDANRARQWLNSHNNVRAQYQPEIGGEYLPLTWSNSLRDEALGLAKEIVANCVNKGPSSNPMGT